jgi:hypothetical protein
MSTVTTVRSVEISDVSAARLAALAAGIVSKSSCRLLASDILSDK